MKKTVAFAALAFAAIACADTVATLLSETPMDVGPGRVVAVAAANKTGTAAAFSVKSVTVAGERAHTNTVASATVTNTIALAASEYVLPGTAFFADGAGSTNGVVWIFIER